MAIIGGGFIPGMFGLGGCIVTDRLPGSRSAGDSFTHEADAYITFTVDAVPTAGRIEVFVRRQDANNLWKIRIYSSGAFSLEEIVGGALTTRSFAAAGTVSDGDEIIIELDDESIIAYVGGAVKLNYALAANFKTETSGELERLVTAGEVSDIVTYQLSTACRSRLGL
jgi:phage-related tail fiber protein